MCAPHIFIQNIICTRMLNLDVYNVIKRNNARRRIVYHNISISRGKFCNSEIHLLSPYRTALDNTICRAARGQ